MKYGPQEFTDRAGEKIILRSPEITDAEVLIRYMEKTAEESPYLLREPGEFHMTVAEEERFLRSQIDDPRGLMLSAFTEDGRHIGNGAIMPAGTGLRTRHRCGMAIALYREFQGRGIGRIIMETLIREAKKLGYEQAELEVVSSNEKAIGLYTSMGFVKYGVHPHNMKYPDGTYTDCDYMVKKLQTGGNMRKNFGKKTIITPLPVVMIGTYDENGVPNCMNAAWAGQVDAHQIIISLSKHKTTDNLERNGEFTVSFATADTVVESDYFGIESGRNTDKIKKAGFHAVKAECVDAPLFEEYPLTLECKVAELQKDKEGYLLIGETVNMSADEKILTDGTVDLGKLRPIMFDSAMNKYRVIGEIVGDAFKDGMKLK